MTFLIGTIYPWDAGERLFSPHIAEYFFSLKNAFLMYKSFVWKRTNIILSVAVVMVINALMTRRLNGDNMPLMTPSVTLHEQAAPMMMLLSVSRRYLDLYVYTLEKNNYSIAVIAAKKLISRIFPGLNLPCVFSL